jgi:hypothetical protein
MPVRKRGLKMESGSFLSQVFLSWRPMGLYWLVWFIIPGLVVAYYVYQDGIKRMPLALDIHPGWWALLCFISGAWGALMYWLMHHSTLANRRSGE